MKPRDQLFGPLLPHALASVLLLSGVPIASAQTSAASTASAAEEEDVVILSPFTVEGTEETGYMASSTLAGTRLRTNLSDIGTAVTVLTTEFLNDIGATDNLSALSYATNMEVGGLVGNYQNAPNGGSWGQTAETGFHFAPNSNTRVRGLVGADNTRNYFRTTVAWDGYNVSRIDLLRGANSILFGLGSPGGVINATTDSANLTKDSGRLQFSFDEFRSVRSTLSYNKVLARDQLAVQFALLGENEEFQQDPAYDNEHRAFITAKYKPKVLNRNGNSFEISVEHERGGGRSNRPRTAPPLDWLTPWIEPVSTRPIQLPAGTNFNGIPDGLIPAYTQFVNQAGVSYLDNIGRTRPVGVASWFDAFGPRLVVNSNEQADDFWRQGRIWVEGVRLANGNTYFGNPQVSRRLFGGGNSYEDTPLQAFNTYLTSQGHPLATTFIPLQITDPSVFDFYNKLLDGPNKREWNDFNQFRAIVSNTFLNGKLGYELSYFREDVTRGQTTYLSDSSRIFVDTQLNTIEGDPNPDFGRPYVQETTFAGNRTRETEIDGFRASAYYELDLTGGERGNNWFRRVIGRHIFNGAYSEDTTSGESRDFQRYVLGPEFFAKSPNNPLFNNRTHVGVRYYLGDSLVGRSTVAGANIGNLDRYVLPEGGTINLRWFDTTWNAAPSVNPATPWVNPLGQTWEEASNPANYVGWTQGNYTIIDALSGNPDDLDYASRSAGLSKNEVNSKILSWQGFMFDGLIVGTYGWREDESKSATYAPLLNPAPVNNVNLDNFSLSNPATVRNSLKVESRNYSIVAHLNRLPWLGDKLPLNVSLSYNEGENFNPTAGRRDVNGNFLAPPQGATEEYGILLSTKDNKYSLRVFKYETAVLNANLTGSITGSNFLFNQFLSVNPREVVNDIESGDFRTEWEPLSPPWSIDDQENIHAPAWRQFEQDFDAAFPGFVDTYLTSGTWAPSNVDTFFSTGFANTENNVSKGWEIEFTANPVSQLRLTMNVSKTEAARDDVPGPSTRSIYEFIQSQMFNPDGTPTAAGLMRSGFDTLGDTIADFWYTQNWIPYQVVQQLNGQPAPELVEWRANLLANYTFTEGRLKGFGVGGAMRFETGNAIGFPYYFDDFGNPIADITNAYERGNNTRYDLWFRYSRPLFEDKIDWSIQLNLLNVFDDDELIPVRANPDGTFANFRIQQGRTWRITNTFAF